VTSVAINEDYVFFGGLDNTVKAINRRKNTIDFACLGHTDTVTGISLSHDGKRLVSNAMDGTLKVWDVRPFVLNNDDGLRCQYTLYGATHNFERNLLRACFNQDSTLVTGGSADRMVNVWDINGKREGQVV
jgi:WD40 repeat protein